MSNKQLTELGEEVSGDSELPDSWLALELGNVIDYGKTEKVEPADLNPDTWVLELEDVEKETSRILARIPFSERQSKSTKNRFKAGDVLYGKLRPYLNKVVRADSDGVCTTEIIPLRGNDAVDSSFLFYWLKHPTFLAYVTDVSYGVNMPRLGTDSGKKAPFILAPLSEQKRIADKLDATLERVDACRERLARVTPLLKRFRQSVLAAATSGQLTADWREQQNSDATACKAVYASNVATDQGSGASRPCPTGPTAITADLSSGIGGGNAGADEETPISATLHESWASQAQPSLLADSPSDLCAESSVYPKDWLASTLEHYIGEGPKNGLYKPSTAYGSGTKILRIDNFYDGKVTSFNSLKRLTVSDAEIEQFGLANGDIVINRVNSIEYLGKCALIEDLAENCVFESNIMKLRTKNSLAPEFLKLALCSPAGREAICSNAKHAVNQASINQGDVKNFPILIPPLPEQTEIVRRVETLFAFADRLEARLASANAAANRLTPSLLAKAFRGELVPQDPTDEPASELLKRLAAQREATASKPKAKKPAV